ncbi:MAG TPA: exonuclease domain-containing protein [Casimicrobiaceae bacterium]|nr:exonuclease domain-containing protein [Casimicrobiaceae bacterium]
MHLFAPTLAFVDLETTGTRAGGDRVTEVGIVRVAADPDGGPPQVDEWSSLVDPGVPIPPAIQAITGITDAMVRGAPTFSSVARDVALRLEGAVFVAHNARFDFGFLKQEFARLEHAFTARVLCTVRLSRRLFPDERSHGLDAVIARHALACPDRHRALGDARALWQFVQALYATLPPDAIAAAVRRLLRTPSLPPQLAPDVLEGIPEGPGVYLFYGDNPLPLYIGKSRHLRERVAAHFSGDWRTETDLRLSAEIRRIDVERTAGELGALLREAMLVKSLMPAHNRALRRKGEAGMLHVGDDGTPSFVPAAALADGEPLRGYGPFGSRRAMRETLMALAHDHALCWRRLGLERRADGPCFGRQVRKCGGACDGGEPVEAHDARLQEALAPLAVPAWPWDGPALVREASDDGRVDVHVLRDWHWLGTAHDDAALALLLDTPPRPTFDPDVTRLLLRLWAKRPAVFMPVR